MTLVNRPDYSVGVWASNGDIAAPTSEKIEIGHIVEKPLKEVMNWIQNRQDTGIVYLMQQGISEWVSTETYPNNSYVKRNGVIYKSLSQNTDRDPLLNTDIWRQAFDTFGSASSVQLEVDKIKTEDGYLSFYIQKSNPQASVRFDGVAFSAIQGFPSNISDQYGYVFKNFEKSGLFYTDAPVIANDGEEIVKFKKPTGLTERTTTVATTAWVQDLMYQLMDSIVPIGAIIEYTDAVVPSDNFMYAHGQAISRTAYPILFSRIGTKYGSGDGSTTFNLPDKRGLFTREWDNGKGIDSGRELGSVQQDCVQPHKHIQNLGEFYDNAGYFGKSAQKGYFGSSGGIDQDNYLLYTNDGTTFLGNNPNGEYENPPIGTETRPKNFAAVSLIRVK